LGRGKPGSQIFTKGFAWEKNSFIWYFISVGFAGFHRGLAFSEAALFETIPGVPQSRVVLV